MKLKSYRQPMAIVQMAPGSPVPSWCKGELTACIRTPDELTLIVAEENLPTDHHFEPSIQVNSPWRAFRIDQQLSFEMTGVIESISRVLAAAQIPIFVVSTYNTDYVLVPSADWVAAHDAMRQAGFSGLDRDNGS